MKKVTKLTNGQKVLQFVRKNPNAKAKEVAKATGININTIYQVKHRQKKVMNLTSTTAPNAQMSLALFSDPPIKRGRPAKVLHKSSSTTEVKDNINHPPHYKVGGIETIDFIEAKSLNYNLGNVVKYISRADHKDVRLDNLKKAQWYLTREISNITK
jgi:hypothetical protein